LKYIIYISIYILFKIFNLTSIFFIIIRQLELYKNGNFNKNFISVYLHNKNVKNDSSIHIPIKFAMVIRNYNDPTIYEYSSNLFLFLILNIINILKIFVFNYLF